MSYHGLSFWFKWKKFSNLCHNKWSRKTWLESLLKSVAAKIPAKIELGSFSTKAWALDFNYCNISGLSKANFLGTVESKQSQNKPNQSQKSCIFLPFFYFVGENWLKTYHEMKVSNNFQYLHSFIVLLMRRFGHSLT